MLIAFFSLFLPPTALADVNGTSVSGIGIQCSNDNMGMSSGAHMSSHQGYKLDYKASSGSQAGSPVTTLAIDLSDAGTNQSISSTTYVISIDRINQTGLSNTTGSIQKISVIDNVLGSNVFLSRDGNLTLNIKPSSSTALDAQPVIHANQDPLLNAWVADPGRGVTIDNIKMDPGAYRAHVELFGVDTAQCIFSTTNTPKFDFYWNADANGGVIALSTSSIAPEFGLLSQVILVISISSVVGGMALLRLRMAL